MVLNCTKVCVSFGCFSFICSSFLLFSGWLYSYKTNLLSVLQKTAVLTNPINYVKYILKNNYLVTVNKNRFARVTSTLHVSSEKPFPRCLQLLTVTSCRKFDTTRKNALKPVKLPSFTDAYDSAFSRRRFGTAKIGSVERLGKASPRAAEHLSHNPTRATQDTRKARKLTGFVPFLNKRFKDFQGHISHFSRTPLSAKKSLQSMSF